MNFMSYRQLTRICGRYLMTVDFVYCGWSFVLVLWLLVLVVGHVISSVGRSQGQLTLLKVAIPSSDVLIGSHVWQL